MRLLLPLLLLSQSLYAAAIDKITPQNVQSLVDVQTTSVMQKDIDRLMALFGKDYRQVSSAPSQGQPITKDELKKIYNSNFMVAKLIISKIDVLDAKIAEDGKHGQLKTHVFTRYLIEVQDKQNILTQEEDWISDIGLENGNLVYLRTEKRPAQPLPPPKPVVLPGVPG